MTGAIDTATAANQSAAPARGISDDDIESLPRSELTYELRRSRNRVALLEDELRRKESTAAMLRVPLDGAFKVTRARMLSNGTLAVGLRQRTS
eukprot:2889428-Prymnesium_polylepis.1